MVRNHFSRQTVSNNLVTAAVVPWSSTLAATTSSLAPIGGRLHFLLVIGQNAPPLKGTRYYYYNSVTSESQEHGYAQSQVSANSVVGPARFHQVYTTLITNGFLFQFLWPFTHEWAWKNKPTG
ncbi:hypothetical protein MKX01_030881 [Papaver californicum]|nr:hypothetical protein MKX01_030881 [Papaver californicum]